ncbi:hypothetical protein DF286_04070 [Sphingosinicella humi]|uniref:Uncharacterized protein n=1 Tax=Allosphingosinicella humi TaxID=2068657 RepID=A0A2U2J1B8_9SPHN|nr:hypothetical protein DF286_04070 [Sphingosinicella humi]
MPAPPLPQRDLPPSLGPVQRSPPTTPLPQRRDPSWLLPSLPPQPPDRFGSTPGRRPSPSLWRCARRPP